MYQRKKERRRGAEQREEGRNKTGLSKKLTKLTLLQVT
jgi:hypothetical protein